MKNKSCPVCKSQVWNYDVVTLDGITFCGDCFHELKEQAKKLGYFFLENNLSKYYKEALKNTIKEYKKLHMEFYDNI